MAVSDILEKMSHGATEADIVAEWDLTPVQIRACLAYAAERILARGGAPDRPA